MKNDRMCSYTHLELDPESTPIGDKKSGKARCPICGRGMTVRNVEVEDGHIMYRFPAHKKKGWWKIGVKKKTSRPTRYRR